MRYKKRIITGILAVGILSITTSFKSDFFEIAKQIEIFTTLFKELNMNYVDETNPAKLMDTAIEAMLEDLDPYTKFWNEQEVEQARIQNAGEYTGIGAHVKTTQDKIILREVYQDYPADKAGLKAGDEIIKIDNITLQDFDEDAGELLKGSPDTQVKLTYLRQGETKTTTLTREKVSINAVPFYQLTDGDIGYIVLTKFNKKASAEVAGALQELKKQGAKKIILDLRNNPGGLLSEAINVSNIFIEKGALITSTKSVIEKYNKTYFTQKAALDTNIPIAVLINGRSASASEIVSGSIQDLDRGVVLGARSFGKGLVQRPKKLTYGTQLKVTISRYYTPSGRCIQALDYQHRDKEGNAIRTQEDNYKEFLTKNGRKVYDGGGILPDIELKTAAYSEITKALETEDIIFNYVTKFYYENPELDPKKFYVDEKIYTDFLSYLKDNNFAYTTKTEKSLQNTLKTAKKEGLDKNIAQEYQTLLASIQQAKQHELQEKSEEIKQLLTDQIVKRYVYEKGLYAYYLTNNDVIKKAKEILNNPTEYKKILKTN